MSTTRVWAVVISCLVATNAGAADGDLQGEGDQTVSPTIELEEEEEQAPSTSPEGFQVHGIGYLSFVAPVDHSAGLNLLLLQGEFKYNHGAWGAFATPRFKVAPVGSGADHAHLFFQQAYGFWNHPYGDVKLGKIYQRFGRLWDYGFYGPLLANDDIKLQPDLGVSAEGAPSVGSQVSIEYAAQYFAVDGKSFALRNQPLFAHGNVRHRNTVVLRVAPTYHLDDDSTVALGVSGSRFEASLAGGHQVLRGAVDANLTYHGFNAFVEAGRQDGADIAWASGPISGVSYLWLGGGYKNTWLDVRCHANGMRYDDGNVEWLLQPGIEVHITDNWGAMAEVAWWTTQQTQSEGYRERSVYLIATAAF